MAQHQRKKIVYARTGGGTQVSMTLDLDALADLVSDIREKIDSKSATLQFIAKTPFADGDTEIGTFGLSKFKHDDSSPGPIGDKFAFDMYLSQKLFN